MTARGQARIDDPDLEIALFLVAHPNFRASDFGYLPGDFILYDLIRLHDRMSAAALKARSQ